MIAVVKEAIDVLHQRIRKLIVFVLSAAMLLSCFGCNANHDEVSRIESITTVQATEIADNLSTTELYESTEPPQASTEAAKAKQDVEFDLSQIPAFSGNPYVEVNNNLPFFRTDEIVTDSFESYSELDNLGRCGAATACLGIEVFPQEERGEIGMIKPSGWHTVRYDDLIEDKYLYNRCHLIAYSLSGENANPKNLITGTRYLNITGMLPFENRVHDYVENTSHHVMYRVTPVFEDNNLVATGVLMEALSVEDKGAGICFNVFCYNVQPQIEINYADGTSRISTYDATSDTEPPVSEVTYILNRNSKKFHYPDCTSVNDMKEKNRISFYGSRDEAIALGYSPCKRCNP